MLALVFAAAGLILFSILYNRQYEDGGLMEALRNPLFVVTLVFPFVPSIVLLWWSRRLDKKFRVMIQELRNRKD
ncbi:MAG: hypothetical protein KDJ75_05710 [Alphaproteobacteria bacterium]|nr:hypothetical protein [Alphaproteobacteria bacterium]